MESERESDDIKNSNVEPNDKKDKGKPKTLILSQESNTDINVNENLTFDRRNVSNTDYDSSS